MELVLFIGIQATGKSSFYRQRFFRTHVRVNLDMLKTRHREDLLVNVCIEGKTRFVVENTNVTREERARYIVPARAAQFRVIGRTRRIGSWLLQIWPPSGNCETVCDCFWSGRVSQILER